MMRWPSRRPSSAGRAELTSKARQSTSHPFRPDTRTAGHREGRHESTQATSSARERRAAQEAGEGSARARSRGVSRRAGAVRKVLPAPGACSPTRSSSSPANMASNRGASSAVASRRSIWTIGQRLHEAPVCRSDGAPHGAAGSRRRRPSSPRILRSQGRTCTSLRFSATPRPCSASSKRTPAPPPRRQPLRLDPLTYLCFSRYLRSDPDGDSFARRILLDGARARPPASTRRTTSPLRSSRASSRRGRHLQTPRTDTASARARSDPNDGETAYHVPEGYEKR